jgi:phosphatidate cytidylyltransferase
MSKAGDRVQVRILTGLVGIPFFLGVLYYGGWPLFALVAGMGLIGFYEYRRMWQKKGVYVTWLGALAVLAIMLWARMVPENALILGAILTGSTLLVLAWVLLRFTERTVVDGLITLGGVFYVGWLLSHLLLLRYLEQGTGWDLGLKWLTFAFLTIWLADSMAYFVGKAIGKRKLAPEISPGKSVEGAVGGGLFTVVAAWFFAPVVGVAAWQAALIAVGAFLLSVLGDLVESALKRHCGVKDSGTLLPGHGGVLDRFDSSLFVLPYIYYAAKLFFL